MKRLALVLAAAAIAATGCGPTCDTGTTLVSWAGSFQGPGAQRNQSCTDAHVAYVDVFLDDQPISRSPCSDGGVGIPGVPKGGNIVTVEGIDADGSTILFRDDFPYTQPGCNTFGVQAFPGSGTVDLNYAFQSGSGAYCGNGSTYIWFTIWDDLAGAPDPASVGIGNSPHAWPCGPTDPVVTLPNGPYELRGVQNVGPALSAVTETSPGTFVERASVCNLPLTFTVTSGTQAAFDHSAVAVLADGGVCQ